jgi:hypothetical protein
MTRKEEEMVSREIAVVAQPIAKAATSEPVDDALVDDAVIFINNTYRETVFRDQ